MCWVVGMKFDGYSTRCLTDDEKISVCKQVPKAQASLLHTLRVKSFEGDVVPTSAKHVLCRNDRLALLLCKHL